MIDSAAFEARVRRLIEIFKEDKVLLDTMARQQYWSFRTVPTMILYTDTIPRFRETIKDLYYEGYDERKRPENTADGVESINDALSHLGHLPNLTSLNIGQYHGKISLNQIAISSPSLKRLEFYSNTGYSGSLGGLRNLGKLIVWDYKLDKHTGSRAHLLPVDSAVSLKNLQLFAAGTRNNVYNSKHLLRFRNLEKLTVFPLCNRLCKTIISANFLHLRKFNTIVYADSNISIDNILRLLQSLSLASLQMLTILFEPYHENFNLGYLELIRTITTHLPHLEDIQLVTGINTSWCRLFSQLRKLKTFAWISADEECFVSDDINLCPLDLAPMRVTDAARATLTDMVKDKMKVVFGEFEPPPSIYVKVLKDEEFKQWDEIFDEYEGDD
jgi:hypothetical protein